LRSYAQSGDQKIMADAEQAKQKMLERDQSLEKFFDNASGYVIFTNIGEGGLIVGAASGKGVVYENGSVVGMADMKKVDVGAQIGGQALAEVIFFETEAALNEFKADKNAFSAEVSAVALETGASKNSNYNDGVVVFTMPKAGMMADASIGGQKFEYNPLNK
jgi:lipid-binding SYLF domain-containing protein